MAQNDNSSSFDIVIYGGTSAGIIAGLQALQMGKTVVVIEPSNREGGLTTGGLGQTDIGNKDVIGGLAREFYRRIGAYYSKQSAWRWQARSEYQDGGQTRTEEGEDAMWTFEPSAALSVFKDWIRAEGLTIVFNERLNRQSGVRMEDGKIVTIQMESGRTFSGRVFIDATYEGDLMAAAGVDYSVGRESSNEFQESLNGIQVRNANSHQFVRGVDPYIVPGVRSSGLLPFIESADAGRDGEGDKRVQAYCFRMCLTDHPENRIPFEKPKDYNEQWFELLFRNFEAGETEMPWINSRMPNRKTDTNNRLGFSTDFVGQNHLYPEAGYEERERIIAQHLAYQQGLMWTLAYHPRIPSAIRDEVSRWGVCADEFSENGGWPTQLYIREARRLKSDVVMNQHHCEGRDTVSDSIGMAAYTMDSHHVRRYVDENGHVRNEGDVQVHGFPPYPISYRAIVPRKQQCENLLVPVCLSSTHIAFGSIRMEPVFMILGQSAATAACLAIDAACPVQDLTYSTLEKHLCAGGQVLRRQG